MSQIDVELLLHDLLQTLVTLESAPPDMLDGLDLQEAKYRLDRLIGGAA